MKKIISILTFLIIVWQINTFAEKYKFEKSNGSSNGGGSKSGKASGCSAATNFTDLSINNVRCRINTGGDMWWDLGSTPKYEIPKGSGKQSMFSAALWIAGLDPQGTLKCAAQRYRGKGDDFWTGPLSKGNATIDPDDCDKYDKHFVIYKKDVLEMKLYLDPNSGIVPPTDWTMPSYLSKENYPAHGDVSKGQSKYLAPFFDKDLNGNYDPAAGDYPYYDFGGSILTYNIDNDTVTPTMEGQYENGKNTSLADQVLKGDQTVWWIMNDKGNSHTESEGKAIGLEIRAQAFAFATNTVINDMTFYSYEIINRSSTDFEKTYFCQWIDSDLGYAQDDYVGCDVVAGLGYCYNGDENDGSGGTAEYGANPPAIGADFFQGPYMDPDGYDNPKFNPTATNPCAMFLNFSNDSLKRNSFAINGVNFGDSIKDNERIGMASFLYHNNSGANNGDPGKASEYYNYLQGKWKDGTPMRYGKDGLNGVGTNALCRFMFPGLTDICDWGIMPATNYGTDKNWTEENANAGQPNTPADRRFMEAAGPFTLKAGAVNYLTVGIPWARANSGGRMESVRLLKQADKQCQALFDCNFKILDGPDAPQIKIVELDKELILHLVNPLNISNNDKDDYSEYDRLIDAGLPSNMIRDSAYRFEGYKVYQLKDATVSVSEIDNTDKARLVAQCDIENYEVDTVKNSSGVITALTPIKDKPIAQLINWDYDSRLGTEVPKEMVYGENKGLIHTIHVFNDLFATGDNRLINHKTYYFIAIAYSYNCWLKYDPKAGVGQKVPYLAGRKAAGSGEIRSVSAIPHNVTCQNEGTVLNSKYGDSPLITKIEGQGNGGFIMDLTKESEDSVVKYNFYRTPKYTFRTGKAKTKGFISVIDPLNVGMGDCSIKILEDNNGKFSNWELVYYNQAKLKKSGEKDPDTIKSYFSVNVKNEQIIPELGIAVNLYQIPDFAGTTGKTKNVLADNSYLDSKIEFLGADSSQWITGFADSDRDVLNDWIRSGSSAGDCKNLVSTNKYNFYDPAQQFEKILDGTIAPYGLAMASNDMHYPAFGSMLMTNDDIQMSQVNGIDIVITSDKTKWTKCPVIEMGGKTSTGVINNLNEGGALKFSLRRGVSLDKDGGKIAGETGMSYFPGYAINVETAERLNMAFGENSRYCPENGYKSETGRDMIWNPSTTVRYKDTCIWGSMHYVYVFGHNDSVQISAGVDQRFKKMPTYDEGATLYNNLKYIETLPSSISSKRTFYRHAMWVWVPIAVKNKTWMENDVKIRLRIAKEWRKNYSTPTTFRSNPENGNRPYFKFNLDDLRPIKGDKKSAEDALSLINVVPNPYYAYSGYEKDQVDNRIKIVNLPTVCTISIYTVGGTLIRQFERDNATITSQDWDLKNYAGIPIASGMYLIHVKTKVGEKIIKWFGVLRPVDLNAF